MSHIAHMSHSFDEGKHAKIMRCVQEMSRHPRKMDVFYGSCEQHATSTCVLSNRECTNKDIARFCTAVRDHMTSHEKEEYCSTLVEADDRYWAGKFK